MSRFVLTAQLQLQAPTNTAQIVRQIQSQLNNVQVNVQVQGTAQATRQVQQVAQSLNAANSAASNLGRTFAISVRRFAALAVATRAVSLFTNTLADATQQAIDFERELVKISQVTGQSLGELRGLTKTITQLATGFGVTSKSLLDVSTVLLQAGLNSRDTEVALKSLAKAALAPNFDSISETAEGAIAILAQFQQGVGALETQLSSINAVAGAFAVEAGDLIDVIRRTGGVFKASGGSLNELLALFTSVRATTRESAESIGTGLRTIFTRIQRPQTIEFLKQFGIELVNLEGKFVGPFEAVRLLSGALAGLGEGDLTFIRIAEELGGFRQIGKVLPLLQQFSTAQSALAVAQKANNGLTKDAETAQQALAIRITKVKEEFLALVRGITETSSFQLFANTSLNLASALIRLADALKPIIPLLTAVATIRMAQGIGGFLSGFGGGLRSNRTFNQGGKVLAFARGGMVPGTGNRDTVPAMLSPGEFVIRKSSVNKLGASNLAAMNENRYADGGKITINPGSIGGFFLRPEKGQDRPVPLNFMGDISNPKVLTKLGLTGDKKQKDLRQDAFYNATKEQQSKILGLPVTSKTKKITSKTPIFDSTGKFIKRFRGSLIDSGYNPNLDYNPDEAFSKLSKKTKSGKLQLSEKKAVNITGSLSSYFPGMDDLQTSSISQIVANNTQKSLRSAVLKSVEPIVQLLNNPSIILDKTLAKRGANRIANDPNAQATTQGFIFEGLTQAITGAKLAGSQSNFDFPSSSISSARNSLRGMFANVSGEGIDTLVKADAKRSNSRDAIDSIKNKIVNDINKGNLEGLTLQKFAKGGGVGTDTIPALLTPGEFVVNKKSAQSIGYGALGRMNKVGKYATGGIVRKFATGGAASGGGNAGSLFTGFGSQLTLVTASLQAMIPPIDENSSAMSKLTSGFLSLLTTVGSAIFALEAFNIKLTKAGIMDFLSGKGNIASNIGSKVAQSGISEKIASSIQSLSKVKIPFMPTVTKGLNTVATKAATGLGGPFGSVGGTMGKAAIQSGIGSVATSIVKLAGPLAAIVGSAWAVSEAFKAAISAVYDFEGRLKIATEAGNIEKAKAIAGERATFEGANVVRGGGATAGAIAGFILGGPIGAAIGAGLGAVAGTIIANGITSIFGEEALDGLNQLFGGNTRASALALAESQAGAVKTQKQLVEAQKVATNAMEDFQNGTITAAEALAKIRAASSEAQKQEKRASNFAIENLDNRAGGASGFGRNVLSTLTLGGVESVSQRNNRLGQQSAGEINQAAKFSAEAFQMETAARTATIRSGFARGASKEDLRQEAVGNLSQRRSTLLKQAAQADLAGDDQAAAAFREAANQITGQIEQIDRELNSLEKEVARAKAAFDAMNLGLRGPTATATAMSASMDKFAAGLEVGGSTFVSNTEFLSQAVTSAAQAMDPADIKSAIDDVANNLQSMGVDPAKFRTNTEAFIKAQQDYNQAFKNIKDRIKGKDFTGMSAENLKDEFAKELTAGLGDDAKKNLSAIINNLELSPDEVSSILAGNVEVFGEKLGEAGKKQLEQITKIAQERNKAEQVVIGFIKQRAEAERNLAQAQKEAVDLYMEGRDIQAKYGGASVSEGEKRGAILARANAGAGAAGLTGLKTGNAAELRARNAQIFGGFRNIEAQRSVEGGMQGRAGAAADEQQKNIQQAQKDQVQTIRDLIKLEEENLKLIQEKNRLEKDSIDSLISGDITKFFEQQAAVGAQAAIAIGSDRLQGAFGSKALGMAAQETKRQQEAGVQELFGQRLAGPGGLTERAYGAAVGSMGITDPRMARVAAGTTGEEEAIKGRLQELGGLLGETGALGAAMAEMQVQTATINVSNAELKLAGIEERGREAAAGMYKGGVVYANRGIFVPRGTDTVPAMLTPGEFVVRREAVQRGNNLQLLQAMNRGGATQNATNGSIAMARGGMVRYRANGSDGPESAGGGFGISAEIVDRLSQSLTQFNADLSKNIDRLNATNFNVKLDTTNINVNLTGTSFLSQLKEDIVKELYQKVAQEIGNYGVSEGGQLKKRPGVTST
jgi:TP901 family phage tail tape measure protein